MSLGSYCKSKNKKFMVILLFFIAGLFGFGYSTAKIFTDPKLCALCHMMKPEYYTWRASSHENVKCVRCHQEQSIREIFRNIKNIYASINGSYADPIKSSKPIPNANCLSCHDLTNRIVTASGDVIIPHLAHEKKEISCTKCHQGVAHGNIANRRVTYRSDYPKWNGLLAKTMMESNFTRPEMDACMQCHRLRKGPLNCNACHKTGMLPVGHQKAGFSTGSHGQAAGKDLKYCNSCHRYMTNQDIKGFEERDLYLEYLKSQTNSGAEIRYYESEKVTETLAKHRQESNLPVQEQPREKPEEGKGHELSGVDKTLYAKTNDYCRKCHEKRPPSHSTKNFFFNHGQMAQKNQQLCLVCHDLQVKSDSLNGVACNSCHPSTHSRHFQWKQYHPVQIPAQQPKITDQCFSCHNKEPCAKCHLTLGQ